MNFRRHQLIIDLINILMQFTIAYLFLTIALHNFIEGAALLTLFLLPAPFLSYAIRKYTKHIWSFLLLHIALLALYGMAFHPVLLVIASSIYLVILTIAAFYQKQREGNYGYLSMFAVTIFLLLYICSYLAGMPDMQQLCFTLAIMFILLGVLKQYLINLSRFAHNHEDNRNMPFQQIRNSNHVLMAFLCSLFFVVMLIFSRFPLGAALSYIGTLALRVLRFLLSLIRFSEPEESMDAVPEKENPADFDMTPGETSWIMELLSRIVQWIATILIIASITALILYAIYRLYRYFYLKSEGTLKDEVEFISPYTKREWMKRDKKKAQQKLFGRSNNHMIRKSFAKAVSTNTKGSKTLSASLTPSQLSEYAIGQTHISSSPSDDEDRKKELLTSFYEKARYSDQECTKDEVKQVKEILK